VLQNGELKATHIVIQNDPGGGDEPGTPSSAPGTPIGLRGETVPSSWTESANMPVLPVRCKVMQTNIQNISHLSVNFFTNGCRKLQNKKLYDMYLSTIIRVI
jgi:hypothetical protein